MEHKSIRVAILEDKNGNEILVSKCKVVSEEEYKLLKHKSKQTLQEKDSRIKELEIAIENCDKTIQELAREIKVLKGEE